MPDNLYARPQGMYLTPEQERNYATATHIATGVATALSAGTLGFVAALVVYLIYKDRGPFVRLHAANSVNIQINGLLWAILGCILALVLVGFLLLAIIPVVMVILHVIGAVKAYNGEDWSPPFTIGFLR